MNDVFIDTGELSDKLLGNAEAKISTAKGLLNYDYYTGANLTATIREAIYGSPTGPQRLFDAGVAERVGNLSRRIEEAHRKLSDLQAILQSGPDELCAIDEKQKGNLSSFWWRVSYYLNDPYAFLATCFGLGGLSAEVEEDGINKNCPVKEKDIYDILDEELEKYPIWMQELIKEVAKEAFGEGYSVYSISKKALNEEDYDGAVSAIIKAVTKSAVEKGLDGLGYSSFEVKLATEYGYSFVENLIESTADYIKDPRSNQTQFAWLWNITVQPFFDTADNISYDIVTSIPGLSDWYEEHGLEPGGSALNIAYQEIVRAISGDETADYVGSYYENHGGVAKGVYDGIVEIVDFFQDYGFKEAWNAIF